MTYSSAEQLFLKDKSTIFNEVSSKFLPQLLQASYQENKTIVDTFEIKGRGWGHSVGMSQNGAIGMASNDFSYEEIIKWYYRGVEIEY